LKIAIAGGGAAGMLASLLLARAGHEVIVLDRDRLEPAPDAESAAASAFRPTAPQIVQPHIVAGLDEFTVGIWPADNGAMQLAVAPLAADHRFRTLRDPEVFTAVLRTVPVYAAWLDVMDPISDVFPMAGLRNTLRRLVAEGAPVVTGLHVIGDSACTTNPTLGRGLSLALSGAVDLLEVTGQHGHDQTGQALAMDRLVADHVAPFYEDQAVIDYARLRAAAAFDPTAFRAFWKIMGMICPPEEVYTDPHIVARTRQVLRRRGAGPPMAQPTREQLLAALTSTWAFPEASRPAGPREGSSWP
jgi:hypothetical protein